jgi:hypothetical protein
MAFPLYRGGRGFDRSSNQFDANVGLLLHQPLSHAYTSIESERDHAWDVAQLYQRL